MEIIEGRVPPNVVALRAGDPIIQALKVAGQERLAILRVLPEVFGNEARESLATTAIERTVRENLRADDRATSSGVGLRLPAIAH